MLVTLPDGSTRCEEITDDLGIDVDDEEAMRANLLQRGVEAVGKIGTSWANEDAKAKKDKGGKKGKKDKTKK